MIQQRPGDVLEIAFEDRWYYLVVITKIVWFGGNIIYAFHSDGKKRHDFVASQNLSGFNICTDLLLPKKEGIVKRIGKVEDVKKYLVSNLIKACQEYRPGYKATEWWISTIDNPSENIARVKKMSKEQAIAMDNGTSSFDLVTKKIIDGYTPDKNPFI